MLWHARDRFAILGALSSSVGNAVELFGKCWLALQVVACFRMLFQVMPMPCFGILWRSLAFCGMVWHSVAWFGILWHALAFCGMVWYSVVRFGILRYEHALQVVACF